MALAFVRNSCVFKKQSGRRMGSEQSSSPATRSPTLKSKDEQISDPCDIIAIVQSRRKDKFRDLIHGLVYNDGNVNATAEHGMTALHYAVLSGDELIIKALIAFGANFNAKNDFNQTPLDMAIQNRKDDFVPLLVSVGCESGSAPSRTSPYNSGSSSPEQASSPVDQPLKKRSDSNPVEEGLKRAKFVLCGEIEDYLKDCLALSTSIRPDEAYAHILQQKELQKFRADNVESCGIERDVTPPPVEFANRGGARILSLDGGGMRGIIQLEILSEIERLTGKRIVELFDWIIGNSIGGIMALGLVYKDMTLGQLRKMYFRIKDEVFSNKKVGFGTYNTKALEKLLQEELGTEMKMGDRKYPRVLVTAVDKSNTPMCIHYFNNCFEDRFSTQPVWKVARYTSAAPLYFTELDNYVDGGVMANNPCNGGLAKIQSFYQTQNMRIPIACMVSVGSGLFPPNPLGSISIFGGVQNLFRLLSDALGQSEAIADHCKTSCEAQGIPFYRFSPPLEKAVEPTETNTRRLLEMMITARIFMHMQDYTLDRLLPLLLMSDSQSPRLSR